ncbi:phosphotransferase [Streptomyces sp. NPDC021622]|uniref:phosphotransferase n=1 Tax=Streptomyces sp. NPDC021622 TaxID=3155013 RepID=UPI0033C33823
MVTARTADTRPHIDEALVRRLVDTQFPQWAGLPLKLLNPAGSDHVIYRLGEDLSVRLPRHAGAIGQARKEFQWLPRLAPHLPLAIPVPVGVGDPDFGYPWPWAVSRWLDGEVATVEALGDSSRVAVELAQFLAALQRFAPEDIPAGNTREDLTSRPLSDRARATRVAIAKADGVFDTTAMTELWNAALSAPGWDRSPVWFHGGVDDATWMRGRGWAMATGLNAYTSYAAVNPRVAAQTTRQITQALIG